MMEVNLNETVTIKLETYESMKAELKQLREDVEEKVVYRNASHYLGMGILLGMMFSFIFFGFHVIFR